MTKIVSLSAPPNQAIYVAWLSALLIVGQHMSTLRELGSHAGRIAEENAKFGKALNINVILCGSLKLGSASRPKHVPDWHSYVTRLLFRTIFATKQARTMSGN